VKEICARQTDGGTHLNLGHGIVPQTPVENVRPWCGWWREFRLEDRVAKQAVLLLGRDAGDSEQIPKPANVVSGRPLPLTFVERSSIAMRRSVIAVTQITFAQATAVEAESAGRTGGSCVCGHEELAALYS